MGKGGRKIQPAGPQSLKLSQVDTNSSPPSQTHVKTTSSLPVPPNYTKTTRSPNSEYPPKTPPKQPSLSQVRSFSPGWEKREEFKKRLDQERKLTLGPARCTPSSPKYLRTTRIPTTPPQSSVPPPSLIVLNQIDSSPPTLPLDSPPIKPSPPANEPSAATTSPASTPQETTDIALSPSATPKKRQESSFIDS